jgi:endonuclease/exonuclease/phosphatase family metal-dependent hydrolase
MMINSGLTHSATLLRHDSPSVEETEMKILSWNIFMLPHLDFRNSNRLRAEALAKELERTDYTIIVFQEAFDSKSRQRIREVLQKNFPFFYGPANPSRWFSLNTSSGLWIVSRIPLKEIGSIRFNCTCGFDRFANKGAILLEGEWSGYPFQLIAVHIQSDEHPWEIRENQMKDLYKRLLLPNNKPGVPQIICGDFNTDKSESEHYMMMLQAIDAEDGDLSGDECYSYSSPGNEITYGSNEKPRLIDYILLRNRDVIHSVTRKIAVLWHKWSGDRKSLSDHNAIEAIIHFTGKDIVSALECR